MRPALLAGFVLAASSLAVSQQAPAAPTPPTARDRQVAQAAQALRPKLVEMRRDFHMHPELSNREERTSRVIAERLRRLGFTDVQTGIAHHGVVATLQGGKPGPAIAVRADMDALPIQESRPDIPYASRNTGVKHACGHDLHMAVQLGVAELLMSMREQIPGAIHFVFQPAEEGAPPGEEGGAELMVKEGLLEKLRPQAMFALHSAPMFEVGRIGFASGPAMAASDRFVLTIRGRGGHAAYPHGGIDPIVVSAQAIMALQTIRSRRVDPVQPLVISVGIIRAGTRHNILPPDVHLEGTVRTLDENLRKRVPELMHEVLRGVTSAHGADYELEYNFGYPVTSNDPELTAATVPTLRRVLGEDKVVSRPPQMGAEDFSYFANQVPGFYYFLGVANQEKGITEALHTPAFDIDEDALVVGVKTMSSILLDYLEREAGR
jgi:amidohydrolase